ncbi:MAG: pyruvate:ferredoxin (flavodoxin) oxidoreductase, partial [Blautia sp.]|nr:pyruvate:ferredoxin (flavodoxin) oxidoreductase [Blautia sp.]
VQNPDVYFQIREANNTDYDVLPAIVEAYMEGINHALGRDYHIFNYYGAEDADRVIVAMGSVSGAICETVDALNAAGQKVGFLQVHLYRPFAADRFLELLPKTVKKIAVLDRCKEMGSVGEPLFQDVCTAFINKGMDVTIVGGRYGLSSKDTDPTHIAAVYKNLEADMPRTDFTIGITDDVTNKSLDPLTDVVPQDPGMTQCKFWGLGSDGTVGANKNSVNIINAGTKKYAQAYFEYDAKKSFGVTRSHLKFSDKPIRGSYLVKTADFVACHNKAFILSYDVLSDLKRGGSLLLNCPWSVEEMNTALPANVRRVLAEKEIQFYTIDATSIAQELGLGSHINVILQAAFFAIAGVIPIDEAAAYMKDAAYKSYYLKGDAVVAMNQAAVDRGISGFTKVEIPAEWANASETVEVKEDTRPAVVRNILEPLNLQKGDELPVSMFLDRKNGATEMGLTAWEKRNIAVKVPVWEAEKCIQCNKCSFVCPHAVIRPYLLNEEEAENAPAEVTMVPAKGKDAAAYKYTLQISTADCTGCTSCVNNCPTGAIHMEDTPEVDLTAWNYCLDLDEKGDIFAPYTVKGSQFRRPLLEFSAACAGCGETAYAKLMTQLFGDRCYWANATGCSQAWGAPMPGIPYTVNKKGHGVAWGNSLFENNAEYSLGMYLAVKQQRDTQKSRTEKLLAVTGNETLKNAASKWLEGYEDFDASPKLSEAYLAALQTAAENPGTPCEEKGLIAAILAHADQLTKKTFWMYGGDGWAYDIGFGGLDHVISKGENINCFIIDTEVYSNTGGQSSKATPIGAVAQFDSSGKRSPKKDIGAMLMSYGNVYVAQVSMGADNAQLLKALKEAEAYDGPSVIVAYTPCQAHGLKCGMGNTQLEMKRAVESGYWLLWRFDPTTGELHLDSKAPSMEYEEFLDGEVRYNSLKRTFPQNAEVLFAKGSDDAKKRYEKYAGMASDKK